MDVDHWVQELRSGGQISVFSFDLSADHAWRDEIASEDKVRI